MLDHYKALQEELLKRKPTRQDIEAIGRNNVVVCRALKIAKHEGLSFEDALVMAVCWLAIQNDQQTDRLLSEYAARMPDPVLIDCDAVSFDDLESDRFRGLFRFPVP